MKVQQALSACNSRDCTLVRRRHRNVHATPLNSWGFRWILQMQVGTPTNIGITVFVNCIQDFHCVASSQEASNFCVNDEQGQDSSVVVQSRAVIAATSASTPRRIDVSKSALKMASTRRLDQEHRWRLWGWIDTVGQTPKCQAN